MNIDLKKISILSVGLVVIVVLWILLGRLGLTTKEISPRLVSENVSEITSSENGVSAYTSNNNLHLLLNSGEEKIVNNFTLFGLGLSQSGSYLSASDGDSCQIISASSAEVVRLEERCSSVMWASDNGYYFFRDNGDSSEDTVDAYGEPSDSEDSYLFFTNLQDNKTSSLLEVSIDNQVSIDWTTKKMLIASYLQDASTLCSIDESNYTVIKDCLEIDGVATAIKQADKTTFLELNKSSNAFLAKIDNGNIKMLGASTDIEKTNSTKGALFIFDESSPNKTSFLSLNADGKKAPKTNITGKRFHGVKKVVKVNESKFLVLAENGLWEVEL
ncbi:MAG: hypothetical protein Q7T41_01470 [Candidatus Saccharibacteria bacterium]|nr:hypothetical protein [Candidatus Saccharibacteria bacterium]